MFIVVSSDVFCILVILQLLYIVIRCVLIQLLVFVLQMKKLKNSSQKLCEWFVISSVWNVIVSGFFFVVFGVGGVLVGLLYGCSCMLVGCLGSRNVMSGIMIVVVIVMISMIGCQLWCCVIVVSIGRNMSWLVVVFVVRIFIMRLCCVWNQCVMNVVDSVSVMMFVEQLIISFQIMIICQFCVIIDDSVMFVFIVMSVVRIVGCSLKCCIVVVVNGFVRLYSVMFIEIVSEIVVWFQLSLCLSGIISMFGVVCVLVVVSRIRNIIVVVSYL